MSIWFWIALVPVAFFVLALLVIVFEPSAAETLKGKWWEKLLAMLALGFYVAVALAMIAGATLLYLLVFGLVGWQSDAAIIVAFIAGLLSALALFGWGISTFAEVRKPKDADRN